MKSYSKQLNMHNFIGWIEKNDKQIKWWKRKWKNFSTKNTKLQTMTKTLSKIVDIVKLIDNSYSNLERNNNVIFNLHSGNNIGKKS